jgi:hypothetical protein
MLFPVVKTLSLSPKATSHNEKRAVRTYIPSKRGLSQVMQKCGFDSSFRLMSVCELKN